MYTIITDRIFWIYFVVTLFFLIIGSGLIIVSNDTNLIAITILWIISNLILLIIIYHAHEYYYGNNTWLLINALFIALLIISTIWAGELGNANPGPLRVMSGILILLGGLILYSLSNNCYDKYIISYWLSIGYMVIWLGFTLYVCIS